MAVEPRHQYREIDRLGEEVGGAGLERRDNVAQGVLHRQHDHRQLDLVTTLADAPQGFEPVDTGHDDIQKNDVRALLFDDVQRPAPVGGLEDPELGILQHRAHQRTRGRAVVDDENRRPWPVYRFQFLNRLGSQRTATPDTWSGLILVSREAGFTPQFGDEYNLLCRIFTSVKNYQPARGQRRARDRDP